MKAFPPVWSPSCRILILGSMPGRKSLEQQRYYGHPQNQFWRLIYGLFGEEPSPVYEERLAFATAHGIALWDVLASCEREGSLDTAIRHPVVNDFETFFARPGNSIRHLFFNGAKAEALFRRSVQFSSGETRAPGYVLHTLPSSSPAHTVPYAVKLERWQGIRDILQAEL
ncbi:hypothetical protein SY83_06195 [Paenibacillus swuensis]|uniref:Uracil-DNA glycosylase-like domain-containing protein n=1 Tax=Paenibacillus swuensis TaxID=1178515 RepID=A0A172TNZ3_9BACL|nr:hypothetical protein SY83_06195 [Paenibacillus swuensis]